LIRLFENGLPEMLRKGVPSMRGNSFEAINPKITFTKPVGLDIAKQQTKNLSTLSSSLFPASINHFAEKSFEISATF
jgi:hypothetical protein